MVFASPVAERPYPPGRRPADRVPLYPPVGHGYSYPDGDPLTLSVAQKQCIRS